MTDEKKANLQQRLQTVSIGVSLLLTLGGVVIGIFNFITLSQLQPLDYRIKTIEANQEESQKELVTYKTTQALLLDKVATKDQINELTNRVDKISSRVDLLVSKLIK